MLAQQEVGCCYLPVHGNAERFIPVQPNRPRRLGPMSQEADRNGWRWEERGGGRGSRAAGSPLARGSGDGHERDRR